MFADVSPRLEPEERKRWREIERFESESPPGTAAIMRLATAPFEALVPQIAKDKVAAGLGSLIRLLQDASAWTSSPEAVLARAGEEGQGGSLAEVFAEAEVERLLAWADGEAGPSTLQATLQGAGLGLGGLLLAATDVPLLLALHLRLLTRLGFCFGFDLRVPAERGYLVGMLELGYSLSDREQKKAALAALDRRIVEAAEGTAGSAEFTRTVLQKTVATFVEKMVPVLLRRKAGSLVPILGGAFAAGTNYLLTRDVAQAARHSLLKRLLYLRARARTQSSR